MVDGSKVKVDGEEAVLHITDQSVMFEKGGEVSGFERSAIRMVKPDGDAMIIAYSAGSEVKSVWVEPMTAVAPLAIPSSATPPSQVTSGGLDEVFEKLYRESRKELEERLDRINKEPENKNLRLSEDEFQRYVGLRTQMWNLMGAKYHFDLADPSRSDSHLWLTGLENEPQERQLDTVKSLHINFLIYLAREKAELNDGTYEGDDVWPEEWDVLLRRFGLSDGSLLPTERWQNHLTYLRPKWTRYRKGSKTPVLARP